MPPRTLVIVPTYNERENLPALISALLGIAGLQVLVVDDGSPDGTGGLADAIAAREPRVRVRHRRGPRGLGLAYIDGMRAALNEDVSLVCQMDADFSHNPADLPRLIAAAASADLVIGSRYVEGGRVENWPLHRKLLSAFANRYVRAITRLDIRDCTSGFRCWRREALARMPFDRILSDGYSFVVELTWEAARAGCRIVETPITFVERRQGASKMSFPTLFESALMPWRLIATGRGRPSPAKPGSQPTSSKR